MSSNTFFRFTFIFTSWYKQNVHSINRHSKYNGSILSKGVTCALKLIKIMVIVNKNDIIYALFCVNKKVLMNIIVVNIRYDTQLNFPNMLDYPYVHNQYVNTQRKNTIVCFIYYEPYTPFKSNYVF